MLPLFLEVSDNCESKANAIRQSPIGISKYNKMVDIYILWVIIIPYDGALVEHLQIALEHIWYGLDLYATE